MKMLLVLVLAAFLGTYAWGWFTEVQQGGMSNAQYARVYWRAVERNTAEVGWQIRRFYKKMSGDMPRPSVNFDF